MMINARLEHNPNKPDIRTLGIPVQVVKYDDGIMHYWRNEYRHESV